MRIRTLTWQALGCACLLFWAPLAIHATSPEKVADWKKRYQDGVQLEKEGRRDEALAVFKGILAEDPQARGSLLMSSLIHARNYEFEKALPFLTSFRQLEPDHEGGLIAGIKIYQGLGRLAEVEALRGQLLTQRASGKNPRLQNLLSYERELLPRPDGTLSVQENLDEKPDRFLWAYLVLDSKNVLQRRIEWTPVSVPSGTHYALSENFLENGKTNQVKIHRLLPEKPDYSTARRIALRLLDQPAN
ncbi:MAG: hypothetical protein HC904_04730 [Blastochloris sp.]|nr:hypothetical protein [Blastochloris sp.]